MAALRYFLCVECGSAFDEDDLLRDGHAPNCIECMTGPGNPVYACNGPYTRRELRRAMKDEDFKIPKWLAGGTND